MEIAVADANILIDLVNSGLISFCAKLGIDFRTIDIVYAEITDKKQRTIIQNVINEGVLSVCGLTPSDIKKVYDVHKEYSGVCNLSVQDIAIMLYALKNQCLLLTGDKKLKEKAAEQQCRVAGILYLTDMMTRSAVIPCEDMIAALQKLQQTNSRLPKALICERIKELQNISA